MSKIPHILLVNSDAEDRLQLRQLLEPLQVEITETDSGLHAVDKLQRGRFDLVVTSIEIGEFDSWRLARFIRSGIYQGGKTLPIIIVTRSWCERITEITARDFGINQLLTFDDRERLPVAVRCCLESSATGLRQRRVLVVEDHADNARLIEKILSPRYEVELVTDGQAGLEAWKARRHDLVLLDIMLPKMSGGELLAQIMKVEPRQPVVMMTAHGSMSIAKEMLLEGAADFVTKPFRADELRRVCELASRREDYLVSNAQVTERMDRLQQLRHQLGNIVDSMPSVLIGVDPLGRVNLWNRQAVEICGGEVDDVQGQPLEVVWPEFQHMEEVNAALQQGEIRKLSKVFSSQEGNNRYHDITVYPLLERTVVGAVIRIDDVTERVLLEERIIQSEKMVSVGQLAAGMAHEINNPLAGVMQNIQVMRNRLVDHSKANLTAAETVGLDMEVLARYLELREIGTRMDAIMESGKRTVQLVENLVSFSQHDGSQLTLNDITDLIDKSVELAAGNFCLKRKFDFRSIEIQRHYDKNLPPIECNPMQIQQVMFNLLMNGAYSMEEKQQQARIGNVEPYQPRFILSAKRVDRRIRVEIEDNGLGMDEETTKRFFEPFYSAENAVDDYGLALSICYFIVTETHRGFMSIESSIDIGSRIVLEFPFRQTN